MSRCPTAIAVDVSRSALRKGSAELLGAFGSGGAQVHRKFKKIIKKKKKEVDM